jgi:ABC-type dipeptide/oligopeptide/nickel transport system ATPase component
MRMKQRAMLGSPKILIGDEPASAWDVTIQLQIVRGNGHVVACHRFKKKRGRNR